MYSPLLSVNSHMPQEQEPCSQLPFVLQTPFQDISPPTYVHFPYLSHMFSL